ncbi:MAG: hypothetical protein K5639_01430 [Eubacterium sp.]|nr:hypothetical protein [Eubacterium sp.]
MEEKNGSPVGLILGIVSIILAIIGGITFGVIGAGVAIVLGIVGIILSVNTKKATDGAKGTGGIVTSILGIIFAAIFAIGCVVCGASLASTTGTSAGSWAGVIGVKWFAEDTAKTWGAKIQEQGLDQDIQDSLQDAIDDMNAAQ